MNVMPTSSSLSSSSISGGDAKAWIVHGLVAGVAVAVAVGAYRKPFVPIFGKPVIQRTWEMAKQASTLDHLVVATDDEMIAACCQEFDADVVKTSESCRNEETLDKFQIKYDTAVNVQGDEPLIELRLLTG